jgi:hypothetical protein
VIGEVHLPWVIIETTISPSRGSLRGHIWARISA